MNESNGKWDRFLNKDVKLSDIPVVEPEEDIFYDEEAVGEDPNHEEWYQEFDNKDLDDIIDYIAACRKMSEIEKIVIERNFADPSGFDLKWR